MYFYLYICEYINIYEGYYKYDTGIWVIRVEPKSQYSNTIVGGPIPIFNSSAFPYH